LRFIIKPSSPAHSARAMRHLPAILIYEPQSNGSMQLAEALDQIERERPDILFLDLVHLAAPALQLTLSHTLSRFPRDSGVLASRQFAADDVQGMEER